MLFLIVIMQSCFNCLNLMLFVFITISCDNLKNNVTTKIIGGRPVDDPVEFGFIVSIRVKNRHVCGGSIINNYYILTAAHCCFDEKSRKYSTKLLTISAGSLLRYANNDGIIKNVDRVIIHEFYDPIQIAHDIALIKIVGKFQQWTSNLHPIQLSTQLPIDRELCKVAGWGVTRYNTSRISQRLLYAQIPIIDRTTCRSYYGNYISMEMICAGGGGKDSCQGDSGGPLVCHDVLDGIVSWGDGCGTNPGVYTATSKYLLWIRKNTDNGTTTITITTHAYLILFYFFVAVFCC